MPRAPRPTWTATFGWPFVLGELPFPVVPASCAGDQRSPCMRTERTFTRRDRSINAGSMADIAFLLLIFFLVTTTMDSEHGLPRLLAPKAEAPSAPVASRNILMVQLNEGGELMVRDERVAWQDLPLKVEAFLTNAEGREDLPQMTVITEGACRSRMAALGDGPERAVWEQRSRTVRLLGPYHELPSQAQVLVQVTPGVPYGDYIALQDALEGVVEGLRDALSIRAFGKPFHALEMHDPEDRERIQAIKRAIPMRIGDAEPADP